MNLITSKPIGRAVIRVLQGDLTLSETDAIVNAANSYLKHGGGVAAAIVRRGGRVIQDESDAAGFVPEGQVYVTSGGALSAKYVIHAVGPRGGDPLGDQKLESAVRESLQAAEERGLGSIAFPAISSGIFGFPKDRCAQILVCTVLQYLEGHPQGPVVQADFVLFDDETIRCFRDALTSSQ
ncbi:MAG: macro domain-containing protein [Armatimonadia bacterium]